MSSSGSRRETQVAGTGSSWWLGCPKNSATVMATQKDADVVLGSAARVVAYIGGDELWARLMMPALIGGEEVRPGKAQLVVMAVMISVVVRWYGDRRLAGIEQRCGSVGSVIVDCSLLTVSFW
ncbi:hypothetical protein M0R45_013770 [Rubus argutus]|uniref:Uncharacterized protein n=1 Tax=Rubus argutus TaxID=59490 RepID=A0AAW1XKS6_RUBAR